MWKGRGSAGPPVSPDPGSLPRRTQVGLLCGAHAGVAGPELGGQEAGAGPATASLWDSRKVPRGSSKRLRVLPALTLWDMGTLALCRAGGAVGGMERVRLRRDAVLLPKDAPVNSGGNTQ